MNNFHIALPTPFREDESLKVEGFEPIVEYLKENGIDSLFISGSTGEQHSLSIEERLDIIDYFNQRKFVNVELIFGVAATRTRDAVRLIQALECSVFDAVMIGFPPYIRPTQQQAVSYVDELLSHTSKEVILYNNPSRTGFDLSPEALHDLLSRHPNILGFKEAGGIHRHRGAVFPKTFILFAAGDVNLTSNMRIGECNGLSSVVGNVFPKEIKLAFEALLGGGTLDSEAIERMIAQAVQGQALVRIKEHYNQLGLGTGYCRSPLGR